MSVIYWKTCDLSDDPEVNEKYRDDVTALVDALYNDDDIHYEFVSNADADVDFLPTDDEVALGLYCSKRRCFVTPDEAAAAAKVGKVGKVTGFYRSPFMAMIGSVDRIDGVFFWPEFKYYLTDYYINDHKIVEDLDEGVFDDWAVIHIFQELMYRIVENHDEYRIENIGTRTYENPYRK